MSRLKKLGRAPSRRGGAGRRRRTALLVAAVLAASAACGRDSGPRLRIVLLTLDTLRYDSFEGDGSRPSTMPLTRARAESCLIFDRFYAATPATQPTHATLFTALHPWQHGVSGNGHTLAPEHTTLAETLRAAGFRTAAVVASFPLARRFGFAQGFDEYDDRFTHALGNTTNWQGTEGPADRKFYSLATSVTEAALRLLDRHAGAQRQFYWFHYFDPHDPYGDASGGPTESSLAVLKRIVRDGAPREEEVRRARRLYDADVEALDRSLDRLLDRLDRDAERVETHLLVTADHGESFGEDGSMFHGRRLTPGQIHVPTFLCSPRVAPGHRDDPAGSIDVTATVLSLAGVEAKVPGRDLSRPAQRPGRALGMRNTFRRPARELRLDGRRYSLEGSLFYLVDERGVLHRGNATGVEAPADAGQAEGDSAARLEALFGDFEAELERSRTGEALDPEARRALEALGYLQ